MEESEAKEKKKERKEQRVLQEEKNALIETLKEEAIQEVRQMMREQIIREEMEKMKEEVLQNIREEAQKRHPDDELDDELDDDEDDNDGVDEVLKERSPRPSRHSGAERSSLVGDCEEDRKTLRERERRIEDFDGHEDSKLRRETAVELARDIAARYVEFGQDHAPGSLVRSLRPDSLEAAVLAAMGRDKRGRYVNADGAMTKEQRREVTFVLDEMSKIGKDQRVEAAKYVLRTLFGVPVGRSDFQLLEVANLLAILKRMTNCSMLMIREEIDVFLKLEKERMSPPGFHADLKDAKGQRLAEAALADVVRFPTRWREFVVSTPDVGRNRRDLISELEKKYKLPLRNARSHGFKGAMSFIFEVEDKIREIEAIIAPIPCSLPREVEKTFDFLLLFKYERLETIRVITESKSFDAGSLFQAEVRRTAPSASKDLEAIERDILRDLKKRQPPKDERHQPPKKGFLNMVHQSAARAGGEEWRPGRRK